MQIEAHFVDIAQRSIYPARVVVSDAKIASVSKIDSPVSGYLMPGFVDAHIHIESSMLIPTEFARLAVRNGTVATVSDPHEIANVLGVEGIEFMLSNARQTPLMINFGAPPCVPATPFESSGASVTADQIEQLLQRPEIGHLSEMMNVPGLLGGDPQLQQMVAAAKAAGKPIDGHAPGLRGQGLKDYIAAGISTDHEAFSPEEALEKLQQGMKILIREGSAAKNFAALSPLIDDWYQQLMFCSDDRHPDDLLVEQIDRLVARAVAQGHDLFKVLQIACCNPVEHYNLAVGQLQIGDRADFIVVKDLQDFAVEKTVIGGQLCFDRGETLLPSVAVTAVNRFCAQPLTEADLAVQASSAESDVIEALDHELITRRLRLELPQSHGCYRSDPDNDILKIVVYNRYQQAAPALAFIKGFGLKQGAIASSIAHDSHNIIAVGTTDEELVTAINQIVSSQGGICAVAGTTVQALPLAVAGLMSSSDAFSVAADYQRIDQFARKELGSPLCAPFMTLSFMALLVIPALKLSDKGLFDGETFSFV